MSTFTPLRLPLTWPRFAADLDAAAEGDASALLATARQLQSPLGFGVYTHRIASTVAGMAGALGGLDALVFTAGVGENVPAVRADICRRLAFLGIELDEAVNETATPEAEVSSAGSAVRVVVVGAREEIVVARAVRGLV